MKLVLIQPKRRTTGRSDIEQVARLLRRNGFAGEAHDVIVLPEVIGEGLETDEYLALIVEMGREFGCHVVGGSHIAKSGDGLVNEGVVVDSAGAVVARYAKANPYGVESTVVGDHPRGGASFRIGDVVCFVMICADFFHAEIFQGLDVRPEIIFVPAFSVSRKATPHMARARWRHAMVARAFEQAAYVAVSDWAYPVKGHIYPSSGVAGLAQPDPPSPAELLLPLGRRQVQVFELNLDVGRALREDQRLRGFDIARQRRLDR